jgi:phosphoglucomutase
MTTDIILPTGKEIEQNIASMILSASGWRKIFAYDGKAASLSSQIGNVDSYCAAAAAYSFALALQATTKQGNATVFLSADSRPTSPVLLATAYSVFKQLGCCIKLVPTMALPAVLATVEMQEDLLGFFYISASHNPVGFNGFKFGFADGSIVGGDKSRAIINFYKNLLLTKEQRESFNAFYQSITITTLLPNDDAFKQLVDDCYRQKMQAIVGVTDQDNANNNNYLAIVADYNGSARLTTIDSSFLAGLGVKLKAINTTLGQFAHPIIPEGDNLSACARFLEQCHSEDSRFILGFVPDCDGDRGNLVYFNSSLQCAVPLDTQMVLALSCLAQLVTLRLQSPSLNKIAVVVNCATSLRIEAICKALGAEIVVVETGEANLVGKADSLRKAGYSVPILGEGSNGGNISYPGKVRDPLSTLSGLVKLLTWRGQSAHQPALFAEWCRVAKKDYEVNFNLADVIASLPAFTSTQMAESYAVMQTTLDNSTLKKNFEAQFSCEWPKLQSIFNNFDSGTDKQKLAITHYQFVNYEEGNTLLGVGNRTGEQSGGLRLVFYNKANEPQGFMWFRGSKTEPVLRLMVDIKGNVPLYEEQLRNFLRALLSKACDIA